MLIRFLTITCFLFMITAVNAQKTLAEKLGYTHEDKLLIIHADDIGLSHSENAASFDALKNGMVNSGSIMVPCPWFAEIAPYVKENPNHDLGIHLTLTAEWKHFKWGPVAGAEAVPSLVNKQGFMYDNCADVAKHATPEDVEKELRAQIERSIAFGIKPTHLDTHMGCLVFSGPEIFEIYLKLGREYGIPSMITREEFSQAPKAMQKLITDEDVFVDRIFSASETDYAKGMDKYYTTVLKSLSPGVNVLLIHTAYDNAEMQAVTIDHPHWGAAWRQADYDFFTSEQCRKLLKANNIKLITWREIAGMMN